MKSTIILAALMIAGCGTCSVEPPHAAEDLALACARGSSGTDMAIVQCYWDHGLATPEDMK